MKRIYLLLISFLCALTLQAQDNSQAILKVGNWEEYIDEDLIGEFEQWYKQQTGKEVKVEYTTYDFPEQDVEEIIAGKKYYDAFCPPEYLVERMLRRQLLQKIDTSFTEKGIPNWTNCTSVFVDSIMQLIGNTNGVNTKDYAIGYIWGNTGVLINTSYVQPEEVQSWGFLLNSKFRNKVIMKDSFSDIFNLLINYGCYKEIKEGFITRNQLASHATNENIELYENLLKKSRPQMLAFGVEDDKEMMLDGKHWMSVTWNGDAKWVMDSVAKDVKLQYIVPQEGSGCWVDCWVIPTCAKNIEAANYWINFISKPEHALRTMDVSGYSSAIGTSEILEAITDETLPETVDLSYFFGPEATAVHVDGTMYPDLKVIRHCGLLRDTGERQQEIREIWEKTKQMTVVSPWVYIAVGAAVLILLLAAVIVRFVKKKKH